MLIPHECDRHSVSAFTFTASNFIVYIYIDADAIVINQTQAHTKKSMQHTHYLKYNPFYSFHYEMYPIERKMSGKKRNQHSFCIIVCVCLVVKTNSLIMTLAEVYYGAEE